MNLSSQCRRRSAIAWGWPVLLAPAAWAFQPDPYQANCTTSGCHDGLVKKPVVHSPAETGSCDACHEPREGEKHKFKLTNIGAALCTDCHEAEEFTAKAVHAPVADGQCVSCHDPHAGKGKGLLRFETVGELCVDCHADTTADLKFLHGPAAAGQCTACHKPHAAEHAGLLTAAGRSLCFECHDEVRERVEAGKHVHQPVESDCSACHKPHGADNKAMLISAGPGLCLDCHDDIGEAIEARVKHSPVSAGDACASCHDPHAAAVTGLLKKGPGEICLSCHDKAITSGERVIANIAAILKDNSNPHGPLRDGDCAACHKPHGGEIAALLSGNYPARFYSGYDEKVYELCFECHEASAFASATTKDETEFRNGEVNLHHLHVNKQTKGRSCRACHEPHASNNSHHIAPGAKFGGWEIPIRYTATETGGSCLTGCHRSYSYDRQAPVTNLTAPDGAGNAPPTTQSATK